MPHFEPQLWNGYKFQLHPSGFFREWLAGMYLYRPIYLNGSRINFRLLIGLPRNKNIPKAIKYDWKVYDRETKEEVKPTGDWLKPSGSGKILFFKEHNKIKAEDSLGRKLEDWRTLDNYKFEKQFSLQKAVQLGYWVDNAKYFITITFTINEGEKTFTSAPMALFAVFDRDDLHKTLVEVGSGAIVGGIVAFILSRFLH